MSDELDIFTDGGSRGNPGKAASAFVVYRQNKTVVHQQGKYLGTATNNQAEYSAVVIALEWLQKNSPGNPKVNFFLDSLLVVNQLKGLFKVKEPDLQQKYLLIKKLIADSKLTSVNFNHIPRSQNSAADFLVNQTLDNLLES